MPGRPESSRRCAATTLGLALLFGSLPLSGAAQITSGNNNQPVQIQADSGIEWQQDAHLYIARGNAVASRGTSEVHADTLIAHYREIKGGRPDATTGGNTEIYRVEAEGHVTLKRDAQTVVGDRAVYDIDQAIAVVTGKGLKLTTTTDVVTARDSLEWYDTRQIAVARGDAVATRNGKTIKGDVLTAYMVKTAPDQAKTGQAKTGQAKTGQATSIVPAPASPKPVVMPAAAAARDMPNAGESKISRVDAQGHVVVSNAIDTGRGNFGVYNADTGIATLIGDVVVERGKDVIRGQRAVMDLNRNISRMLPAGAAEAGHPRVQGLFIREDRAGHGAASPDRAPAAKEPTRP